MVFSDPVFLFVFLPVLLVLYFVVGKQRRNAVLLVFGLLFYFLSEGSRIIVMLGVIAIGYLSGVLMKKHEQNKKQILIGTLVIELGIFFVFRYLNSLSVFLHGCFTCIPVIRMIKPLGISFFILQAISYSADVYRGTVEPSGRLSDFALYLSMFPQLIAGPIVRYSSVEKQIRERSCTSDIFGQGVSRFTVGLSKKVILADTLGMLAGALESVSQMTVLGEWMTAAAYTLQLYLDFSGYSDMAIGLGNMFGFSFPENFRYPLCASSFTDFWRRWHMTLTSFLKDYVYIPLGGSRKGMKNTVVNVAVVWLLSGLWHGSSMTFILWGMYCAGLLILEKTVLKSFSQRNGIISHIVTLCAVLIGFVIFREDTLSEGLNSLYVMSGLSGMPLYDSETVFLLKDYAAVLLISCIACTPVIPMMKKYCSDRMMSWIEPACILLLLVAVTSFMVDSSFSPFLYFRF